MTDRNLRFETFIGADIARGTAAFGALHTVVFYDWPYLFAGAAGATPYISRYTGVPDAALFVCHDGDRPVAAATCLPLADETANVQAPFLQRGLDLSRFFYYGEGIVLAEYRGQGVGVRLFELREQHARAVSNAEYACFCSVRRPADHPLRPADAVGNDAFWRRRGFQPWPGMACTMSWTVRGDTEPSQHVLDFWIKPLHGAPLP